MTETFTLCFTNGVEVLEKHCLKKKKMPQFVQLKHHSLRKHQKFIKALELFASVKTYFTYILYMGNWSHISGTGRGQWNWFGQQAVIINCCSSFLFFFLSWHNKQIENVYIKVLLHQWHILELVHICSM